MTYGEVADVLNTNRHNGFAGWVPLAQSVEVSGHGEHGGRTPGAALTRFEAEAVARLYLWLGAGDGRAAGGWRYARCPDCGRVLVCWRDALPARRAVADCHAGPADVVVARPWCRPADTPVPAGFPAPGA